MELQVLEELIIRTADHPELRPQLVSMLLSSRVAIPLDKGLDNGVLPTDAKPLTLNADQGFPVLAVFTTPDRALPWVKQQPAFQHVLVTDFEWAVRTTRPPFGIAINPGYQYAFVLSPDEVVALAKDGQSAS